MRGGSREGSNVSLCVIELQRITIPLIARRRPLRDHERVWDETPDASTPRAAPNRRQHDDDR